MPARRKANKIEIRDGGTVEVQLTQGQSTILDLVDWQRLPDVKWYASKSPHDRYYVQAFTRESNDTRKRIHMARLILDAPDNLFVDHIDGDPLNNRRSNLRLVTAAQNSMNSRIPCTNKTGFKGVRPHGSKWRAYITLDQGRRHLGLFDTPEEAASAYNDAAQELFGNFARLNQVPA